MAPRRRSTPSLSRCTRPQKTPRLPQTSLHHFHALRLETSPFKRKRENSRKPASSELTICYRVSTRIGCTKIQATTWMEESRKKVSVKNNVGKLVCMPTQCYDAPSGKVGKIFVGILSVELYGVCARRWNAERVIVFQSVILQRTQDINISTQIRNCILF